MKHFLFETLDNSYYAVFIYESSVRFGISDISYCIRKHPYEDFFSLTFIYIDKDYIEIIEEEFKCSLKEIYEKTQVQLQMYKEFYTSKGIFINILTLHDDIIYVTSNLTILYKDSNGKLNVSKREKRNLYMPGFRLTDELKQIFKTMGGFIHV